MPLKDSSIAIYITNCTIHVLQPIPTMAGWRDDIEVFFVKNFNYLVGSISPNVTLHLTGLQQLSTYEFRYVQHSFKEEFRLPDNLELEK
jgi:hypothetical protein